MADPALCGNGFPCHACALRREAQNVISAKPLYAPCNACGGTGRIPRPTEAIVADHVAEARRFHWKDPQ